MTKQYQVWVKSKENTGLIKTYPYKLQAYTWCWLNGFVVKAGRYGYWLNDRVEIKEVCDDGNNKKI